MAKRIFDILASAVALLLFGMPMAVIAVIIRMESPGHPLFVQERAGHRGRPFEMFKFRSMRSDVDPYGCSPQSGEDPRLTRVGKFLRETSLDELPQLLNVLRGDMSLVGPRPLYMRQAADWDERQRHRLDVLPGITGYAQAFGRGSLTIERKIDMDLHYVAHQSFLLDMKIILQTVLNVLRREESDIYEKRYSEEKEREFE